MMTNKYLEKIAEQEDKAKTAAKAGVGLAIASGSSQRLLGYHTVYHGTTHANAQSIRKNGFDPKEGGGPKGSSHAHYNPTSAEAFKKNSKGKIHVTKSPIMAGMFAGFNTQMKGTMPGFVKARVSDKMYKTFKTDYDAGIDKDMASTTKHKISSKFVAGGKGSAGPAAFMKKRHLKAYYATDAGKSRAARGAAMLIGGLGIAAHYGSKLKNND
jgi:hypothetical protein